MSADPATERKPSSSEREMSEKPVDTRNESKQPDAQQQQPKPQQQQEDVKQQSQPAPAASSRGGAPSHKPSTAPYANSYAYEEVGQGSQTTGLFALVHPLIFCAMCFIFISFVALLVAIPTVNWYVQIHGDTTTRFGLYRTCVNDDCKTIEYQDVTYPDCSREASGWQFRNNVAQGTALTSVALSLVIFVVGFLSKKILTEHKCAMVVTISCLAIFLLLIGGAVRFVFTYEIWLYCDKNFCQYMEEIGDKRPCDASFGYSFALLLIAMGSALVATIFVAIKLCLKDVVFAKKREITRGSPTASPHRQGDAYVDVGPSPGSRHPPASTPHQQEKGSAQQSSPAAAGAGAGNNNNSTAQANSQQPAEIQEAQDADDPFMKDSTGKPKGIPAPPPGQWEYHEDCGLYWSNDEFLYLDPYTRHFFDPQSDMWYDPDADQWYEGDASAR